MLGKSTRVVDVHYHIITPDLAKQIADCVPIPSRYVPHQKDTRTGALNVLTEAEQIAMAEETGVDTVWVSPRVPLYFDPGVLPASSPHSLTVARTINDYFSSMCQRYPERFMAFAEIPLALGDAAIEEMRRALNNLGLHGICLQTNYNGKYLDAPEFRPFFDEANRQRAVIHLHPTAPMGTENVLKDYYMLAIVGYPYDTTLTMSRLAWSGALEQLPNLTFILSHIGGTIPFLWWRINWPYLDELPGSRDHIKVFPTTFLERCCYDTAVTDTDSLMLTYKRVGGDHLMFGTDLPFLKDSSRRTLKMVEAMDIPDETRAKILGGNALALSHRPRS